MLSYNPNVLKDKRDMFLSIAEQKKSDTNYTGIDKKVAEYEKYFNTINRLRKLANVQKTAFKVILDKNNIMMSENVYDLDANSLQEIIYDPKHRHNLEYHTFKNLEEYIRKIRTIEFNIDESLDMMGKIKIDDNMEMDTLDEHYIDMDKEREKRHITEEDMMEAATGEINYKADELPEDIPYTFDGTLSLKDKAIEVYGESIYWGHILNYDDNLDRIKEVIDTDKLDIERLSNDPEYIKGVTLKIPREIIAYTDESPTQVLKTIKL